MELHLKKAFSLFLVTALAFSTVACTNQKKGSSASGTTGSGSSSAASQTGTDSLPIVKNKLTLKFVCYNWGDASYGNNMEVFQELEKRTNIHLDWELLPADDNLTKLNLIMASGDLPDLVSYSADDSKATFDKYAAAGALAPLDDLIDKYAPDIKAFFDNPPYSMPDLKAESRAADGKYYSLPGTTEIGTGQIFAIRQDWLDKVGMPVPQTTDDLLNVLKAFKDKNLSGDGNTIPFCPDNGLQDLTILMNAFGAHESFYVDSTNKKVGYGPLEQNYEDGLKYCNELYKAGLIDKDYINANDTDAFRAKIAKNEVGMIYAWPLSGLGYGNTALAKVGSNAKYVAMLPVKGPNGDRYKEDPQNAVTPRTVITSANKHKVETIEYLNYLFTKEGRNLMNYGVEGTDYTLDSSGSPQFTDAILKDPKGADPATARLNKGMQVGLPFIGTFACESQTASKDVSSAWEMYIKGNVLYPNFPSLPLDETQIGDISGKLTDLTTYVQENSNKFIMGTESFDNYPKFVATVKSMGIDDILQVYNEAYQKYQSLNK